MSIDWDKAPTDATDYFPGNYQYAAYWAKKGFYCVEGLEKEGWREDHSPLSTSKFYARPAQQPKPWSGPEDGLPPVGMRVMVHECSHDYTKKFNGQIVRIVAHDRGDCAVFAADRFIYHALIAEKFKLPPTAEQLAAEKRETAIRELMDIAQVDCRVTAARLVDAGFKR